MTNELQTRANQKMWVSDSGWMIAEKAFQRAYNRMNWACGTPHGLPSFNWAQSRKESDPSGYASLLERWLDARE